MAARRRLCCGTLMVLVLAGQLLLVARLSGRGVITERAAEYIGESQTTSLTTAGHLRTADLDTTKISYQNNCQLQGKV